MFKRVILMVLGVLFSLNAHAFWFFSSHQAGANEPKAHAILANAPDLNPHVLDLALQAYGKLHQQGYDTQQMLTIVDYSRPSVEPRLWVIDLKDYEIRYHTLVANGANSGGNIASIFSDQPSSHTSSIGVFLTAHTYFGKHGYSLRLDGLEPGFNDKARARDIVIHAANYVSTAFAKLHGRLGRSWGCFALNPAVTPQIIHEIKEGTVLFAYYPDSRWLGHSHFFSA